MPYFDVKNHPPNDRGRDYFVGDIHGEYELLMSELDRLSFDPTRDRLFSVGDLIDRGPDSLQALRLIREPWFYGVLGNHELMLNDLALCGNNRQRLQKSLLHTQNGGDWAAELSPEGIRECVKLINMLPLRRTIEFERQTIGLVHAGWRWDWNSTPLSDTHQHLQTEFATWSSISSQEALDAVSGVDFVVSGHQNTSHVVTRGNRVWIDTLLQGHRLTILSAGEILELVSAR